MLDQSLASPTVSSEAVIKTLLLADLVDSTALVTALGDERSVDLWMRHDRLARDILRDFSGVEIDKSDGFLLLFDRPIDATLYALSYHAELARLSKQLNIEVRARVGIHVGEVFLRRNDAADVAQGAKQVEVFGLAVQTAARIMSLARGGQSLLTRSTFELARRATVGGDVMPAETCWMDHGTYEIKGIDEPIKVCEVGWRGLAPLTRPPDSEKAWRTTAPESEVSPSWRPTAGQSVPGSPTWKLCRKLGAGGYGEVWLARHKLSREKRAAKFWFSAEWSPNAKRELSMFNLLRSRLGPRADQVRIHAHQFDKPPYHLEMEYVSGGNLAEWAGRAGGIASVPMAVRLELIARLADALAAVHSAGVVHKDVKPANVLIRPDKDGTPGLSLSDFSIAQLIPDYAGGPTHQETSELVDLTQPVDHPRHVGTDLYLAPEYLIAGTAVSIRRDIYALGVLLYQVVLGDLSRPLAHGWEQDVDDEFLREDIADCVAGLPSQRLASAHLLAERLRSLETRQWAQQSSGAQGNRWRSLRRVVKTAMVAVVVLSLVRGAMLVGAQRTQLARAHVCNIVSLLSHDAPAAMESFVRAPALVRRLLIETTLQGLTSSDHDERSASVRASLWTGVATRETFWSLVNGGPIWESSEWLELCAIGRPLLPALMRQLRIKAVDGSAYEKYVAFCLMGAAAFPEEDTKRLCARAVARESHPGVISAAYWCASRLGVDVAYSSGRNILVDELSGLTFVHIPGSESFRPGSPPGERGRGEDEDRSRHGLRIEPLWITVTELTCGQLDALAAAFADEVAAGSNPAQKLRELTSQEHRAHSPNMPVHGVSPVAAEALCTWLNRRARDKGFDVYYRLPTEEEWEHAARAGSSGPYSFGARKDYLNHFATCGQARDFASLVVARKMPSFFGLFDMHGGVWEVCASAYRARYDAATSNPRESDADRGVVRRGGAADSPATDCRSASRSWVAPDEAKPSVGIRMVLQKRPAFLAIPSATIDHELDGMNPARGHDPRAGGGSTDAPHE